MKSHTTARFRAALAGLPAHVQRQARAAYKLFLADPTHPSRRFKRVHETRPIYSARVGLGYRALCVREGEDHRIAEAASSGALTRVTREVSGAPLIAAPTTRSAEELALETGREV